MQGLEIRPRLISRLGKKVSEHSPIYIGNAQFRHVDTLMVAQNQLSQGVKLLCNLGVWRYRTDFGYETYALTPQFWQVSIMHKFMRSRGDMAGRWIVAFTSPRQ